MDGRPRRSRSRPTAAHDGARGLPGDRRYRRRGGAGPRPAAQRDPRRPLPRDEPRMRRGALPDAGPRARGEPACKRAAEASRARGGRPMIPESWYLTLSAALFTIGVVGVVIRRNPLVIFMSIKLALNAANLALVAFGQRTGNPDG